MTTSVTGQAVVVPPTIDVDNVTPEVVDSFMYLGSTITSNVSLDAEFNMRASQAAATMSKLGRQKYGAIIT